MSRPSEIMTQAEVDVKAAQTEATVVARLDAQDTRLISEAQGKVRDFEHEEEEIANRLEQITDEKAFQLRVIEERQAIMAARVNPKAVTP